MGRHILPQDGLAPSVTPQQLRALRLRLELTQGAAARLVGVDGRAWRYWEAGARPVPVTIGRLLMVLEHFPKAREWLTRQTATP